jgi:hypothetical protein
MMVPVLAILVMIGAIVSMTPIVMVRGMLPMLPMLPILVRGMTAVRIIMGSVIGTVALMKMLGLLEGMRIARSKVHPDGDNENSEQRRLHFLQ